MPQASNQQAFGQLIQEFMLPNAPKVLIEGDSWVSHPFLANLSIRLDSELQGQACILNLAQPGDTSKRMLGRSGHQFKQLTQLIETERYGYRWNFIFISAAGNDIVGNELEVFIENKAQNPTKYGKALIKPSYDKEVAAIAGDYERLLKSRDKSKINSDTPIITHAYSYLIPRPVGTKIFGAMLGTGWVYRYLEPKGITDPEEQKEIVRALLDKFYDALLPLQAQYANFLVADTRLVLSADPSLPNLEWWHDEIHPNYVGFKKVGQAIRSAMETKGYWPS